MSHLHDRTQRPVRVRDFQDRWHDAIALGPAHPRGTCADCRRHDFTVQWVEINGSEIPWPVEDVVEADCPTEATP